MTADRVVFVRWLDSHGPQGWTADPVSTEPGTCRSVGWLVGESEKAITIAAHVMDDPTPQRHGELTIPRCSIVEMVDVEMPKVDSK